MRFVEEGAMKTNRKFILKHILGSRLGLIPVGHVHENSHSPYNEAH